MSIISATTATMMHITAIGDMRSPLSTQGRCPYNPTRNLTFLDFAFSPRRAAIQRTPEVRGHSLALIHYPRILPSRKPGQPQAGRWRVLDGIPCANYKPKSSVMSLFP